MATKPMKSIKLPGLEDTYTFVQKSEVVRYDADQDTLTEAQQARARRNIRAARTGMQAVETGFAEEPNNLWDGNYVLDWGLIGNANGYSVSPAAGRVGILFPAKPGTAYTIIRTQSETDGNTRLRACEIDSLTAGATGNAYAAGFGSGDTARTLHITTSNTYANPYVYVILSLDGKLMPERLVVYEGEIGGAAADQLPVRIPNLDILRQGELTGPKVIVRTAEIEIPSTDYVRVLTPQGTKTVTPNTVGSRYILTAADADTETLTNLLVYQDGEIAFQNTGRVQELSRSGAVFLGWVRWDEAMNAINEYHINGAENPVNSLTFRWKTAQEYGAKGDGETDDTDALQAAFTAAGGGNALYIQPGTYMVSRTLTIPSGAHIIGGGMGQSIIKLMRDGYENLTATKWRQSTGEDYSGETFTEIKAHWDAIGRGMYERHHDYRFPIVMLAENATGTVLENLGIEGDTTTEETVTLHRYTGTGEMGAAFTISNVRCDTISMTGLYVTGTKNVIRQVQVTQINYAGWTQDAWDSYERQADNGSPGWSLQVEQAHHCHIEDSTFDTGGYQAAGVDQSTDCTIRGCYFGNGHRTGLQIHSGTERLSVSDCIINNQDAIEHASITMHANASKPIQYVKFVNCDIRNSHIQCVQGYENHVQIMNCRMESSTNRFVVITLGGTNPVQGQGWQIIGNEMFSTRDHEVNQEGWDAYGVSTINMNVDNSMVANNILHTNANTPVVMTGENNLSVNNLIVSVP